MNAEQTVALKALVLSYLSEDKPIEMKRELAACIKRAVNEWMQTSMEKEVGVIIRRSLERTVEKAIARWQSLYTYAQPIPAKDEKETTQ